MSALQILKELIVQGKNKELDNLNGFNDTLEKLINDKQLRLLIITIYKELYLWLGDYTKILIKNIKETEKKE